MKIKRKNKKAWGGRFGTETSQLLDQFNASISFDRKLYLEDIQGSMAHAEMLCSIAVLSKKELNQIKKGLKQVQQEIEAGQFSFDHSLEDIHMAVEGRLTEIIGPLGGKLHTARSRNDQVALDFRMFCQRKAQDISNLISQLQLAIVELADSQGFYPMPGYTHLQRAQPVYFAHHLLAYFEKLNRDQSRIKDYLQRIDECPLGAGALAGSTVKIDRNKTAELLGFSQVTRNSLDTVSDRDFVAELLFIISLMGVHLSRLSEELVLWVSQEFQFIELPQKFCTGSSMMPQKVNPDVPELVRGKTGRFLGNLVSILTTLKGLPLAYNKDLQEDKEPLFDSVEQMELVLKILKEMIPGIKAKPEKMLQATKEGFLLATDMAEYLVNKKMPFREAHEVVGMTVQYCIQQNKTLEELSLEEFKKFSKKITSDISDWLNIENSINKRIAIGGTAKINIKKELKRAKKILAKDLK